MGVFLLYVNVAEYNAFYPDVVRNLQDAVQSGDKT
jgi:hypothetical protein